MSHSITRETKEWGALLTLQPLIIPMQIQAEVTAPAGRSPSIRLKWSGVPATSPVGITDAMIWIEGLRAVVAEARRTSEQLKQQSLKAKRPSPRVKSKPKAKSGVKPRRK
jgi:hypothetical protein